MTRMYLWLCVSVLLGAGCGDSDLAPQRASSAPRSRDAGGLRRAVPTRVITGAIRDARTGIPLEGALVRSIANLANSDGVANRVYLDVRRSSATGRFSIGVRKDNWPGYIETTAAGYAKLDVRTPASVDEVEVALEPARTLRGRVVRSDGRPAQTAVIVLQRVPDDGSALPEPDWEVESYKSPRLNSTRADATGDFAFHGVPTAFTYRISVWNGNLGGSTSVLVQPTFFNRVFIRLPQRDSVPKQPR